jgi:hypothetical protein
MMVEQGMQVYAVVFKRVWRSMKEEFKKLHQLNALFLKPNETFGVGDEVIRREDYSTNPDMVAPVADPNILSTSHRVMQAQAVRQAAFQVSGYDKDAVERYYLRALRVDGYEAFYKGSDKLPPPQDPKLLLEQAKAKGKAAELQLKHIQFMAGLKETVRLNSAKIAHMEAQIIKTMQEAGIQRGDQRLRAIDMTIKAMQEHNNQLIQMASAMQSEEGENESTTGRGSVPGVAEPTGDEGLLGTPSDMEEVPDGTMVEGSVY